MLMRLVLVRSLQDVVSRAQAPQGLAEVYKREKLSFPRPSGSEPVMPASFVKSLCDVLEERGEATKEGHAASAAW